MNKELDCFLDEFAQEENTEINVNHFIEPYPPHPIINMLTQIPITSQNRFFITEKSKIKFLVCKVLWLHSFLFIVNLHTKK